MLGGAACCVLLANEAETLLTTLVGELGTIGDGERRCAQRRHVHAQQRMTHAPPCRRRRSRNACPPRTLATAIGVP
jgi:hypothetical protein